MRAALLGFLLITLSATAGAEARVLEVGPGRSFIRPSAAAAVAQSGDVIRIAPGTYEDCTVWRADRIVIEGEDADRVIIGNRTCAGKGVFIIQGSDVTVRGVTLVGARTDDANGAGIRAEGVNLTVERVRFLRNENGILYAGVRRGTLIVRDSAFIGNGSCEKACAHGIYVGQLERLSVEGSRFIGTRQGHHIKSRALRTEIIGNEIEDGRDGTASYLIDVPNGGAVLIRGNRMSKGPRSENRATAIAIGAEGVDRPTPEILIEDNSFTLDGNYRTVFVTNHTATPAVLVRNRIPATVRPLRGDGRISALAPGTHYAAVE
ncbi:hypothetical protein KPL78_06810 [Roseomonas sp. HJA6]|uniref:Right handed beta helix domain-containing protein n=1 Tax=Roseomonas alba TaxID=2846776 RepID=A0ABS7A8P9_9PROT|nr:hypothetical protein [Neoroseomonas alba]MBW6397549.1 hypothetical protein [Neoroseomonas alba]